MRVSKLDLIRSAGIPRQTEDEELCKSIPTLAISRCGTGEEVHRGENAFAGTRAVSENRMTLVWPAHVEELVYKCASNPVEDCPTEAVLAVFTHQTRVSVLAARDLTPLERF